MEHNAPFRRRQPRRRPETIGKGCSCSVKWPWLVLCVRVENGPTP
jgi:hypothetical protein